MAIGRLRSARLTNESAVRSIDDALGNLEQVLAEFLGIPIEVDLNQALTTMTEDGEISGVLRLLAGAEIRLNSAGTSRGRLRILSTKIALEVTDNDGASWRTVFSAPFDEPILDALRLRNSWLDGGGGFLAKLRPLYYPGSDSFMLDFIASEDDGTTETVVNRMDLRTGLFETVGKATVTSISIGSPTSIPDQTWTPVVFNSVVYDPGNQAKLPQIQLTKSGTYILKVRAQWAATTTASTIRGLRILNTPAGSTQLVHDTVDMAAPTVAIGSVIRQTMISEIFLDADDDYTLAVEAFTKADGTQSLNFCNFLVYRVAEGV